MLNIVITSHDCLEQRGTDRSFRYTLLLLLQPSTLPSDGPQPQKYFLNIFEHIQSVYAV